MSKKMATYKMAEGEGEEEKETKSATLQAINTA